MKRSVRIRIVTHSLLCNPEWVKQIFAKLVADQRSNDTSCSLEATSYSTCRFGEGECRRNLDEHGPFQQEGLEGKEKAGPAPGSHTLFLLVGAGTLHLNQNILPDRSIHAIII